MPRQREFDPQQALQAIKDVFWEYGYEGGSMARIEAATGLRKQSLYRAIGDKRAMYLASLRDYDMHEVTAAKRMLRGPGAPIERFDTLLRAIIDNALTSGDRRGCLLCNASVDQAPLDAATEELVLKMMQGFLQAIAACFSDAPSETAASVAGRAHTALAGYFGLRVMIKAGMDGATLNATREALLTSIRTPACSD